MAYHCLGLKGKTVVTSTMTYAATVAQLLLVGADVLLVDCDENFQIDLEDLEEVCNNETVHAVVVADLYGDSTNFTELQRLALIHGFSVVEDAAEAFGCVDKKVAVGTRGRAGSFSFFANKVITCGEGGVVVTNDNRLAEQMASFRNQCVGRGYNHDGVGTNFRMTNMQAAIGLAQLEEVEDIINTKRAIANRYREELKDDICSVYPRIDDSSEWMPVFALPQGVDRTMFQQKCAEGSVDTRPAFTPIHMMDAFKDAITFGSVKLSEELSASHFLLPSFPDLTADEQAHVIAVVNGAF